MSAIWAIAFDAPHRSIADCVAPVLNEWMPDQVNSWSGRDCVLWAAVSWNTLESKLEQLPLRDVSTGVTLVADARLDNRSDLISALESDGITHDAGDSTLILHAWLKWGHACVEKLVGDFALVIWDPRARELFCARDPFGCRPLYYARTRTGVLVGSDPVLFRDDPRVDHTIDPEWIADRLTGLQNRGHGTPFTGISRVPAGHFLCAREGQIRLTAYWRPQPGTLAGLGTENAIVEHGRFLLDQAVTSRIRSAYPIGAELTSGLDSGGIVGTAVPLLKKTGRTLSVFSRLRDPRHSLLGADETAGVDLLCNYLGITQKFVSCCSGAGLLELLDGVVNRHSMPLLALSVLSEGIREQAVASGIRTVLSGYAGDSCFSANEPDLAFLTTETSWQWRWRHHRARLHRAGKGSVSEWMGAAIATLSPRLHRFQTTLRSRQPNWLTEAVAGSLASEWMASRYGVAARRINYHKHAPHESGDDRIGNLLRPELFSRIESSALLARRFKQTWTYPLLDRRLIEYVLACPPQIRTAEGWTRRLARRVIEDRVPREVAWQLRKNVAYIPGAREQIIDNAPAIRDRLYHWSRHSKIAPLFDMDRALEALIPPTAAPSMRWNTRVSGLMGLLEAGLLLQRKTVS